MVLSVTLVAPAKSMNEKYARGAVTSSTPLAQYDATL